MSVKLGLFAIFLVFLSIPISEADVIDVMIIPEEPVQGDVVTIQVSAEPREEINVKISFSKTIPVSNGVYEFLLEKVEIPSPPNSFAVKAVNVKKLKVSVKIVIWVTKSAEAENGTATVSQGNVPRGRYDVKIHGDALDDVSGVDLDVTASTTITTDENGFYEYSYDTSSIPPGEFKASVDGTTKTVTLREPKPPPKPKPKPDETPPSITNPKPTGTINITVPTISANYTDDKGIDMESVRLTLDGMDVTENASVTAESVIYVPQPLANATAHLVELTVADTSANQATLRWNFTVILPPPRPPPDRSPPIVTMLRPVGIVNTTTPTISASYSDDKDIDVDSVSIILDGMDVTENASVTAESVIYVPQPLANATAHLVELTVADTSANQATLQWNFTIIMPPPPQPPPQPYKPAEFNLSNLEVTPTEVEVGGEVDVTVTVSNIGEQQGNHTVTLQIENGPLTLKDERTVTLDAGTFETISFKITPQVEGDYVVKVDGLTCRIMVFESSTRSRPFPLIWVVSIIPILVAIMLYFILRK